eukprot:GHVT01100703.1.p1 GENE.GHVT01100703.1~~GHVT01100703.1.p1  ORF type:complete len:796 (+),score=88.71 GHVT01100703.1:1237-3624(+)
MIMDLLGPSLEDLLGIFNRQLPLNVVLRVGIQMLDRLEFVHSRYLLHRDIKPDNFLVGMGHDCQTVYLIDFGLAKKFRASNGKHVNYKEGKNLTGTARYSSIATHAGIEQSRRDDLEGLFYVWLYLLRGVLPWQGLKASPAQDRYEKIHQKKMNTDVRTLCEGLPNTAQAFLVEYIAYCRGLAFDDKPNYRYLRSLLASALQSLQAVGMSSLLPWTNLLNPAGPSPSVLPPPGAVGQAAAGGGVRGGRAGAPRSSARRHASSPPAGRAPDSRRRVGEPPNGCRRGAAPRGPRRAAPAIRPSVEHCARLSKAAKQAGSPPTFAPPTGAEEAPRVSPQASGTPQELRRSFVARGGEARTGGVVQAHVAAAVSYYYHLHTRPQGEACGATPVALGSREGLLGVRSGAAPTARTATAAGGTAGGVAPLDLLGGPYQSAPAVSPFSLAAIGPSAPQTERPTYSDMAALPQSPLLLPRMPSAPPSPKPALSYPERRPACPRGDEPLMTSIPNVQRGAFVLVETAQQRLPVHKQQLRDPRSTGLPSHEIPSRCGAFFPPPAARPIQIGARSKNAQLGGAGARGEYCDGSLAPAAAAVAADPVLERPADVHAQSSPCATDSPIVETNIAAGTVQLARVGGTRVAVPKRPPDQAAAAEALPLLRLALMPFTADHSPSARVPAGPQGGGDSGDCSTSMSPVAVTSLARAGTPVSIPVEVANPVNCCVHIKPAVVAVPPKVTLLTGRTRLCGDLTLESMSKRWRITTSTDLPVASLPQTNQVKHTGPYRLAERCNPETAPTTLVPR